MPPMTRQRQLRRPNWPFGLNRGSPQAKELVGWWPLADGRGYRALDMSGYGNHGTLTNGPLWSPGLSGGACVAFDGTDDFITMGNPAALNLTTAAMTIAGWVRPRVASAVVSLFGKDNGTADTAYTLIQDNANFEWRISAGSNAVVTGGTAIAANTWYHVCGVYSGSQILLYVNRKLDATAVAVSGNLASIATNFEVASRNGGTLNANVIVQDVRVYNRAFSAAEVAALYAPATRWDLYGVAKRKVGVTSGAAAPAAYLPDDLAHQPGFQPILCM